MHLNLAFHRSKISNGVICALAGHLAATACGVEVSDVTSRQRSRRVSVARQIGMYLAHTAAGLPLVVVATHFLRDRTTVAHACRLIEDRRDDRRFDTRMVEIENLFRAICGVGK